MHTISRDTPALYITAVAKDRLPVFRTDAIKVITCKALDEARKSGGFAIYAYVIMPDHFHAITDAILKPSKVIQYLNGIISRRVIDHLKVHGHNASLLKLKRESGARGHRYSLWDHHSNAFPIFSEDMLMQKVNYIHQNPVRAGLVERVEDYRWSSVRIWKSCPLEDELLMVDIERINWRKGQLRALRRLCRSMCGKALPFRSSSFVFRSGEAQPRRCEKGEWAVIRKAGGFPHIRRQSRKTLKRMAKKGTCLPDWHLPKLLVARATRASVHD